MNHEAQQDHDGETWIAKTKMEARRIKLQRRLEVLANDIWADTEEKIIQRMVERKQIRDKLDWIEEELALFEPWPC
jgi:hypothetical protein